MPTSPGQPGSARPSRRPGFPNPWSYLKRRLEERFERRRSALRSYLELATPIALQADRLYGSWHEMIAEPIQDGQKAANHSAVYWWQITDSLKRFEGITPPGPATRYHRLFAEALRNASSGAEIAKSGFRSNKFSEVSRGLGFFDRYAEVMSEAEREMGRLVRKYRLADEA